MGTFYGLECSTRIRRRYGGLRTRLPINSLEHWLPNRLLGRAGASQDIRLKILGRTKHIQRVEACGTGALDRISRRPWSISNRRLPSTLTMAWPTLDSPIATAS